MGTTVIELFHIILEFRRGVQKFQEKVQGIRFGDKEIMKIKILLKQLIKALLKK